MVVKKFPDRFFLFFCLFIFCVFFLSAVATAAVGDHITRTETGFYYTVQKGDTLWDLSRQFSNSPWVWPEMWHYNPHIKNPHLIYPGQRILVYQKEWEGEAQKETAPSEKPLERIQTYLTFTDIERVGFIRNPPVTPAGTIFKVQGDATMINTGNLVYIYPEDGAQKLAVGDKYSIYRTIGPIKGEDGTDYGVQHFLTGVVEITSVTPEFATGRIISAYRDILVDDQLMPYEERDVNIPIQECVQGLDGKIIKSERDEELIAQYATVFINKGKNDGVAPGQSYSVYLQESARTHPGTLNEVTLTPFLIGEIIILHTEESTSTALIRESKQNFLPGNLVRALSVSGN